MKMSDVFNLPVAAIEKETIFGRGIHIDGHLLAHTMKSGLAAAHAINQHDALTQLNKELVEALGNVLWDICQEDEPNVSLVYLATASGVLRKAKELAE